MTSHELAKALMTLPDLPVNTYALGHHYSSTIDRSSHGRLKIGIMRHNFSGGRHEDHIVIGNIGISKDISGNFPITEILFTDSESKHP